MGRMRFYPAVFLALLVATGNAFLQTAQHPDEPGYEPGASNPAGVTHADFVQRTEMIPMRDGVKLHTIILVPLREGKMPVLMTRTPYGASVRSTPEKKQRLRDILPGGDDIVADSGYIRVLQDVRGRNRSEGEYVVTRPLRGPLNPTPVDHATDTYDTIEWLLENVPENNGRFGMIGTSYDGLMVLMGLVDPHPALKAAVPLHPMVDGWRGDDWFHNGAFRQITLDYLKLHLEPYASGAFYREEPEDDYVRFLDAVSAGGMARRLGIDRSDFWGKLARHPGYDGFWQGQAMDSILSERPLEVPTLYVHGLWDQEDVYGPIAAYMATEGKDTGNDGNFLVIGPWNHGGSSGSGYSLGPLVFNSPTGLWFRRNILLPFLDGRLKENAVPADTPPVLVYETGSNVWRTHDAWPLGCESGCRFPMQPLYLQPGFGLDFARAETEEGAYDGYVSDPMNPVPYCRRPIQRVYAPTSTWPSWLVDSQEIFSERPDVLTYRTGVLDRPLTISGLPVANLFASTSGTDVDFVVKLIDAYPESYPERPDMEGYQLMISADILRGRYRTDPGNPAPVEPGRVECYRWNLPAVTHVFQPGHRVMVQIQSSWFPLYDRNPQAYVENIFNAAPGDFRKATQRIFRSGKFASYIELPVVENSQP